MKELFEDLTDYILNEGITENIPSLYSSKPAGLEAVIKASDGYEGFEIWYMLAAKYISEMEDTCVTD